MKNNSKNDKLESLIDTMVRMEFSEKAFHQFLWGADLSTKPAQNFIQVFIEMVIISIPYAFLMSKIGWMPGELIYETKGLFIILPVLYAMLSGSIITIVAGVTLMLKVLILEPGSNLRILLSCIVSLLLIIITVGVVIFLMGIYMTDGYVALNIMMIFIVITQVRGNIKLTSAPTFTRKDGRLTVDE